MKKDQTFDYILVGAGASGCVLANRLSANSQLNVLLLEAGASDDDERIHSMNGFVQLWGSEFDWALMTEPQTALSGRQIVINQGKALGGGGSINAMMYVRGNRLNYDQWNAMGCDGWGYDDVLPYFKKSEDYEGGASEYRGAGGPIPVRPTPDSKAVSMHFRNAAVEAGFQGPNWDYNGAQQEDGAGPLQFNISAEGKRFSTADAFLKPAMSRSNLTVETKAFVTRILFEGKKAVGVEYLQDGALHQVKAGREVIICASAFFSPKLLMLSGIGPAEHLKEHGISVVADLPGVGENLSDHLQLPVIYKSNIELENPDLLTGNILFTRTRPGMQAAPPDLQLLFSPGVPSALSAVIPVPRPACIFLPILAQPYSRGSVRLRSSNPQDPPVVNPNYLQCQSDVDVLVDAVKLIRKIASMPAFADLNGGEMVPGADADVEAYVRGGVSTIWHPVGTCKMGRDALAVVDPHLKVYGVEGLRVADASVMPTVPSGNTYAGCVMIAEKLADELLKSI